MVSIFHFLTINIKYTKIEFLFGFELNNIKSANKQTNRTFLQNRKHLLWI